MLDFAEQLRNDGTGASAGDGRETKGLSTSQDALTRLRPRLQRDGGDCHLVMRRGQSG